MNNEIANKIFDSIYDECDLRELKDKKVIAQELGFKLSTVAIIECEIDEHLNKKHDKLVEALKSLVGRYYSSNEEYAAVMDNAKSILKELGHEI